MKQTLLTLAAISAMTPAFGAASTSGSESLLVDGEIRSFYINRNTTSDKNGVDGDHVRRSLAIGGNLGVVKKDYGIEGLSTGVRFYTTEHLGEQETLNGDPRRDRTLFGQNGEGYSILGEAYLNYERGTTNVKVGRQQLSTPLAGGDDARMLPNLFEAAVVSNGDITNTHLIAAHVASIAYGSFANAYAGGVTALISGYGLAGNYGQGKFQNMGEAALGTGNATGGVNALAATYESDAGLSAQLWFYDADEILQALYGDAEYRYEMGEGALFGAMQFITESDTGDSLAGKIDSHYSAYKIGAAYGPLSAYYAGSSTDSSDTKFAGVATPWGGMPAYTQGMATRHQFFEDTTASKLAVTYKQGAFQLTAAQMTWEIGEKNNANPGVAWDATETIADAIYRVQKNLMLRYRINVNQSFDVGSASGQRDWTEHRAIVSYRF